GWGGAVRGRRVADHRGWNSKGRCCRSCCGIVARPAGHPSGFVIVMIDRSAGGEYGGCDGIRAAGGCRAGAGTKGGK
ncbi:MAG: hypothetical protein ACK55I_15560, partial [bacterium]